MTEAAGGNLTGGLFSTSIKGKQIADRTGSPPERMNPCTPTSNLGLAKTFSSTMKGTLDTFAYQPHGAIPQQQVAGNVGFDSSGILPGSTGGMLLQQQLLPFSSSPPTPATPVSAAAAGSLHLHLPPGVAGCSSTSIVVHAPHGTTITVVDEGDDDAGDEAAACGVVDLQQVIGQAEDEQQQAAAAVAATSASPAAEGSMHWYGRTGVAHSPVSRRRAVVVARTAPNASGAVAAGYARKAGSSSAGDLCRGLQQRLVRAAAPGSAGFAATAGGGIVALPAAAVGAGGYGAEGGDDAGGAVVLHALGAVGNGMVRLGVHTGLCAAMLHMAAGYMDGDHLSPGELGRAVAGSVAATISGTAVGLVMGPVIAATKLTSLLLRPAVALLLLHRGASWLRRNAPFAGVAWIIKRLQATGDLAALMSALGAVVRRAARSGAFRREFSKFAGVELLLKLLSHCLLPQPPFIPPPFTPHFGGTTPLPPPSPAATRTPSVSATTAATVRMAPAVAVSAFASAADAAMALPAVVRALAELSRSGECRETMVAGGAPRLLVHVLAAATASTTNDLTAQPVPLSVAAVPGGAGVCVAPAMTALSRLSAHPLAQEQIRDAGGAFVLCRLLERCLSPPPPTPQQQHEGIALMDDHQQLLLAAGCMTPPLQLTRPSAELACSCATVMGALALDPMGKRQLGAAGAVHALYSLLATALVSPPPAVAASPAGAASAGVPAGGAGGSSSGAAAAAVDAALAQQLLVRGAAALHAAVRGDPDNTRSLAALGAGAVSATLRAALGSQLLSQQLPAAPRGILASAAAAAGGGAAGGGDADDEAALHCCRGDLVALLNVMIRQQELNQQQQQQQAAAAAAVTSAGSTPRARTSRFATGGSIPGSPHSSDGGFVEVAEGDAHGHE